jgi:ribosomal protein S11
MLKQKKELEQFLMIKQKYKIRKFIFKNGMGKLLFFKRHSNLFLVFLDSQKNHIVTLTSGSCKVGKTRKQKLSPLNMGIIIKKLKIYLNLYKIKSLQLYIKQKITYYFRTLLKLFKFYKINISMYTFILNKCHGVKRGRTPRRV